MCVFFFPLPFGLVRGVLRFDWRLAIASADELIFISSATPHNEGTWAAFNRTTTSPKTQVKIFDQAGNPCQNLKF